MKKKLALALMLMASSVSAETVIELHGASKHIGFTREYSEFNPGIGVIEYDGAVGISAGAYRDSMKRLAGYASIVARTGEAYRMRLGVDVGMLVTSGHGVSPLVMPWASVRVSDSAYVKIRSRSSMKRANYVLTLSIGLEL